MYVIDSVAYKYNSPKNLAVKRKFINYAIMAKATQTISFILDMAQIDDSSPVKWESDLDRPLVPRCPFCGEEICEDPDTTQNPEVTIQIDPDAYPHEKYVCPVCFNGHPTEEDARDCCASSSVYICGHCHNAIEPESVDYIDEVPDPEEWYIVTDKLGKALAEVGQMVLKSEDGLHIWGRAPSEIPIEEDQAISDVCFNLGILDGQENFKEVHS